MNEARQITKGKKGRMPWRSTLKFFSDMRLVLRGLTETRVSY